MSYISVEVDVDVDDVLSEVSNYKLLKEVESRSLELEATAVALNFEEWELVELICKGKSIIEADEIRSFFK